MITALVTCGALAREVLALKQKYDWKADVLGVPALLHNHPKKIPSAVLLRIRQARRNYDRTIVIYGDCGTSGDLDKVLESEGVERVSGPHCYEMYADQEFNKIMIDEPGTFFLTDCMLRSLDHLVIQNLGLDRLPELHDIYFSNYTSVVYLAQSNDDELTSRAKWAADFLRLPLKVRSVGYGALESRLVNLMHTEDNI